MPPGNDASVSTRSKMILSELAESNVTVVWPLPANDISSKQLMRMNFRVTVDMFNQNKIVNCPAFQLLLLIILLSDFNKVKADFCLLVGRVCVILHFKSGEWQNRSLNCATLISTREVTLCCRM